MCFLNSLPSNNFLLDARTDDMLNNIHNLVRWMQCIYLKPLKQAWLQNKS